MSMLLRPLEAADFSRGFFETLGSLAPIDLTPEEAIEIWKARTAAGVHSIVCIMDDQVVGTASLIVEKKYIHRGGLVGHIEDVAVRTDYWRRGIGTKMVAFLTQMAKNMKCYKVILNCHDHLAPFYARLGYKRYDSGMRINCADFKPEE